MATGTSLLHQAIELQNQGRIQEAAALFEQLLATSPNDAAAIYSLGVIRITSGNPVDALRLADLGVNVAPAFALMWSLRGSALQALGRKAEAIESYDRALQLDPKQINALLNSGVLLREMFRHLEALERFNQILTFDPDNIAALGNCGILLTEFKRSREAIAMFERLLALNPNFDFGQGLLAYERLHICDWSGFEESRQGILEGILAGKRSCKTLALMAITDSVTMHFLAARIFAHSRYVSNEKPLWRGEKYRHDRLRIAYVSPDFREHPVGHLTAGIFERHDRGAFETIAISLGIDDNSRLRARMVSAFDHFVDAREMSARDVAQLMRSMEVDIAVDLAGYTSDSRMEIFSFRPAPIQMGFLGYPGTLGLDYMDYIIADRHVIPPEHQPFFTEKVAYLPQAYLPTDNSIQIPQETPSRAECNLPEEGVVFCSFSHDYKISPPIFDIWMRLLSQVPGSVLWLMSRNEISQQNLRNEAAARGVEPSRLIFANRVPRVEDHLARYRQADIFLDTHPYNAHTTAADALMAGCPVVTYMGNAFPARVAASLLHTFGLPELVTHSLADYEALALKMAMNPSLLADIKARVSAQRVHSPLFDTEGFCRNLEGLYRSVWDQHARQQE